MSLFPVIHLSIPLLLLIIIVFIIFVAGSNKKGLVLLQCVLKVYPSIDCAYYFRRLWGLLLFPAVGSQPWRSRLWGRRAVAAMRL